MSDEETQTETQAEDKTESAEAEVTPTASVTLVGTGRDVQTRLLRRMNRFPRRAFRLGDIMVRPGRRVDVHVSVLRPYLSVLKEYMERGSMAVMIGDRRLEWAEVAGLLGEVPEAGDLETTELLTASGSGDDPVEHGEITEEQIKEAAERAAEKHAMLEAAGLVPDSDGEKAFASSSDGETEPAPASESPAEAQAETEPPPAEDAPEEGRPAPLPDGWRDLTKKNLMALLEERGIEVPEKHNKGDLVSLLEAWEAAYIG